MLDVHMKDKIVIGPFNVGGLTDGIDSLAEGVGGLTEGVSGLAISGDVVISFKVKCSGVVSPMEVKTFEELKSNTTEDFGLEGKDFLFVC